MPKSGLAKPKSQLTERERNCFDVIVNEHEGCIKAFLHVNKYVQTNTTF